MSSSQDEIQAGDNAPNVFHIIRHDVIRSDKPLKPASCSFFSLKMTTKLRIRATYEGYSDY